MRVYHVMQLADQVVPLSGAFSATDEELQAGALSGGRSLADQPHGQRVEVGAVWLPRWYQVVELGVS